MRRRCASLCLCLFLVLPACSRDSKASTVESGPGDAGSHLEPDGPPSLGAGPAGALAVLSAKENTRDRPGRNPALLLTPDGRYIRGEKPPDTDPLTSTSIAATGDGFVVFGLTCPIAVSDDEGCSGGTPAAFEVDRRGGWTSIAAPPSEALSGAIPLQQGAAARFVTPSGSVIAYDRVRRAWSTAPTGVTAAVGGCDFGESWSMVGSNPRESDSPDPAASAAGLRIVTSGGRINPLVGTASGSGRVTCDRAQKRIAYVSAGGPTYVSDGSRRPVALPPIPSEYEFGEAMVLDGDRLEVPLFELDVPGAPAVTSGRVRASSGVGRVTVGSGGSWSFDDRAALPVDGRTTTVSPASVVASAQSSSGSYVVTGVWAGSDPTEPFDHLELVELGED